MSDEQSGLFLLRQRTAKTGNISQREIMQRLPVSVRKRLIAALFPWKHRKTSKHKSVNCYAGDDFLPGESAQMTATRKSESYDYLVLELQPFGRKITKRMCYS